MFPFLPLPANFDAFDGEAWEALCQNVLTCLLQSRGSGGTLYQTLMHDFFWMSFVAAYLAFPFGDHPDWDELMPKQGNFILCWWDHLDLAIAVMHQGIQGNFAKEVRHFVWQQWVATISHYFSARHMSYSYS